MERNDIPETEYEDTLLTPRYVRLAALGFLAVCGIAGAVIGKASVCAMGLLLGGAVSLLLFRQQELSIRKAVETQNKFAVIVPYVLRMAIRAAAVIIAIKREDVSVICTVLGLLSVPYSIYFLTFLDSRRQKPDDGKNYIDYSDDAKWEQTKDETPMSMMREIKEELRK